MTNKFNSTMFIGSGFEYSLRGTESSGYTVTTILSSRKRHFKTLEEAHDGIMRSFRVFMAQKG